MNYSYRMLVLCFLAILSIKAYVDAKPMHQHPHNGRHHNSNQHHCIAMEDLDQYGDIILQPFFSKNMHWERNPAVYLVSQLENAEMKQNKRRRREQERSCPNLQTSTPSSSAGVNERSISPWSYQINYDEHRYPQKLAFAECLCSGCIDTQSGKEISSVNSVKIYQTMMVLRRKPCPTKPKLFTFEVDYEKVPVACTCALPKY
ncbi:interleukin-17C [Discoglossus pictus]